MPLVSGTYQGIPVLDGQYSFRAGVDAGRGWVRVLLSDLGGSIPQAATLEQLRGLWIRRKQNKDKAIVQSSAADLGEVHSGGATVTGTDPDPKPAGFQRLQGPFGDLVMRMTGGDAFPAGTRDVTIKDLFWVEANLEDVDIPSEGAEGVVRLELADERIIWPLGGYVSGRYNRTINDAEESIAGRILQWDPALENPSRVVDISENISAADKSRPILDERTLFHPSGGGSGVRPWTAFQIISQVLETLPGPPRVGIVSRLAANKVFFNIDWTPGTLSLDALRDVLTRFDLVIAPTYDGTFFIFDKGQNATGAGGGGMESLSEIPAGFASEKNLLNSTVSTPLSPLSVEVIGDRIYEETFCPQWEMVLRDDGSVVADNGAAGRMGQWVNARELMATWGVDFDAAARSVLGNWDKDDSTSYKNILPDDDDVSKKRRRILKQNFFKSFMVVGAFRNFLPMVQSRAEGASHGLNLPNLAIQRKAHFFADGWGPRSNRTIGLAGLFGREELAPVDDADLAKIDFKNGVITFKEPKGVPAYRPDLSFLRQSDQGPVVASKATWDAAIEDLSQEIIRNVDAFFYRDVYTEPFNKNMLGQTRIAVFDFLSRFGVNIQGVAPGEVEYNVDDWNLAAESVSPIIQENIPTFAGDRASIVGADLPLEAFNLSEFILVEPRIIGIWAWERNTGRADDFYRARFGPVPEAAPYPLRVKNMRQYIDVNGSTNREALDTLARIEAEAFIEKATRAVAGSTLRFAGTWPVACSGEVPEVTFKVSVQDSPQAETVILTNKFHRSIEGRPPAVATWTAFQKPAWRTGGAR